MKKIKLFCLIIVLFGSITSGSIWARGGYVEEYYFGGHHHHYGGYHHYGGHHIKGHYPGGRHHHYNDYGLRESLGIDGGRYRPYYRRDSSPYNGVYGLGYGGGYPLVIYIQQEDSEKADTEPQTNDWSNWNAWHWCSKPEGYYPYVKKCLNDWIPSPPQPTASKD